MGPTLPFTTPPVPHGTVKCPLSAYFIISMEYTVVLKNIWVRGLLNIRWSSAARQPVFFFFFFRLIEDQKRKKDECTSQSPIHLTDQSLFPWCFFSHVISQGCPFVHLLWCCPWYWNPKPVCTGAGVNQLRPQRMELEINTIRHFPSVSSQFTFI